MKWHAIYSTPGGEFRAMLGIDHAGIEAFCPVEKLWGPERKRRRTKILRALIPRYLFARFDGGRDLGKILEIDGVDDVLRVDGGKIGYADGDRIAELRRLQELGAFDRTARHLNLRDGEKVEIGDPRFTDLEGSVQSEGDPEIVEFGRKIRAARAKDRIKVALANGMIMNVPANKVAKTG